MSSARVSAFASVVLDVDSTLCATEGINVLARRRGGAVAEQIAELTHRVSDGEIPINEVYGKRLAPIQPTIADIEAVAQEYERTLEPGAEDTIRALRLARVRVMLVSGGIRQAIAPLARRLGFAEDELHAVALHFDAHGTYLSYDTSSPLARAHGKPDLVRALLESGALLRRVIGVGDGSTDAELRGEVDSFGAFVGVVRREPVVRRADVIISSFGELTRIVLP